MPGPYLASRASRAPAFREAPRASLGISEERWLFEALVECYLPLLDAFDRMAAEGVLVCAHDERHPLLAAMLKDDLLRRRFDELPGLRANTGGAGNDARLRRRRVCPALRPSIAITFNACARLAETRRRCRGGPRRALGRGASRELLSCSATHCYLPGNAARLVRGSRPQLEELGVRGFERLVGRTTHRRVATGVRLSPELRSMRIARAGIRFDGARYPRHPQRPPAATLRSERPRFAARTSSRLLRPRYRVEPASLVARRRATRATSTTETSTATSASTSPSPTWMGRWSPPMGRAADDWVSSISASPARPRLKSLVTSRVRRRREGVRASTRPTSFSIAPRSSRICALATMATPPIVVAPYDAELYGH